MGVLTDLVCATAAEIAALDPELVPFHAFPGLDIKGTGLVELATLLAFAKNSEFDQLDEAQTRLREMSAFSREARPVREACAYLDVPLRAVCCQNSGSRLVAGVK